MSSHNAIGYQQSGFSCTVQPHSFEDILVSSSWMVQSSSLLMQPVWLRAPSWWLKGPCNYTQHHIAMRKPKRCCSDPGVADARCLSLRSRCLHFKILQVHTFMVQMHLTLPCTWCFLKSDQDRQTILHSSFTKGILAHFQALQSSIARVLSMIAFQHPSRFPSLIMACAGCKLQTPAEQAAHPSPYKDAAARQQCSHGAHLVWVEAVAFQCDACI